MTNYTLKELSRFIDQTNLKQDSTDKDVEKL